jgi:hypothetical protein
MTGAGDSAGCDPLDVYGDSNTVYADYVYSSGGIALYMDGANFNSVSYSTIASVSDGGEDYPALDLDAGSSSNTVSRSYIFDAADNDVQLQANSNENVVSQCQIYGLADYSAGVWFNGVSYDTVAASVITENGAHATDIDIDVGSSFNLVELSTLAAPSGQGYFTEGNAQANSLVLSEVSAGGPDGAAVQLTNDAGTTLTGDFVDDTGALDGVDVNAGAGDSVALSTVVAGLSATAASNVTQSSGVVLSGDYFQASRGVWVQGSTATVLSANTIVALGGGDSAVLGTDGNVGLTISSNVIRGTPQARGIWIGNYDAGGNAGPIVISSNVIGGAEQGIEVGSNSATAQIWITSNVVVSLAAAGQNDFGIYLYDLPGGATVQNNSILLRAPGNLGAAFVDYGLYVADSTGVVFSADRVNNPGMITGGSYSALYFTDAHNTEVYYDDVFSSGTGLTNHSLVRAQNGSSGLRIRNSVFASSVTVSGSSQTLSVDAGSEGGFLANYNDWFSSNTLAFQWGASEYGTLAAWRAGASQDAGSISGNPLWWSTVAGAEDFHPMSTQGRWSPSAQAFVDDAANSPTIDAADPTDPVGGEVAPNGGRANQGSYGGTAEASRSEGTFAGCVATKFVAQGGGYDAATITGGLAALYASVGGVLPGPSCVIIKDGATYPEQVTVANFVNNGSSITIKPDPGTGLTPSVDPPAGTAAFLIANASVTVSGIDIVPTHAISYGVFISSTYVQLSGVNVQDAGGRITSAGIMTSSWTTVSYASVTVGGASATGFWLPGSTMTTVSYSSAAADGASGYALWLDGASSNTIASFLASNPPGNAAYLDAGSDYNTISRSTMASDSSSSYALWLLGASYNTITQSYVFNPAYRTAVLDTGSTFDTISGSTISSSVSNYAVLYLNGASSVTVTGSLIVNTGGPGAYLNNSYYSTISQSTMTVGASCAGYSALTFRAGASWNTASGDVVVSNGYCDAAFFQQAANDNVITQSTLTSVSGGLPAIYLDGVSSNTVSSSYIQGSTAVYVQASTGTVIGGSALAATSAAGIALELDQGSVNLTLSSSVLTAAAGGAGVYLSGDNGGWIVLSTNTISGAGYGVYAATQTAGTRLWIASNTIVPAVTGANNTYGLYFDGLVSGATVENNAIVYRTPGSMSPYASDALYAKSASGLQIDHNRIDEPGLITGGSFVAADFVATKNTEFKFNDVNSTGTGLTNAYMLEATNGSGLVVKDNVVLSSLTVSGSSATVVVDAASEPGFASDYNDYFSSNAALAFQWGAGAGSGVQGLANWRTKSGGDADSISANPLWYNAGAGAEDFHPLSVVGRFLMGGGGPVTDGAQSPTIDAGDPSEGVGLEPSPNGGTANQGSYGLTAQASESAQTPTSLALVAVGSSSATVSFGAVGANGYVVQASTVAGFSDVLYSSDTTTGAIVLAPQGLDPNTTYYLRAGALWGTTTIYAPTVLSTATLAPLVAGTTVYRINVTSMVVNWIPLTLSPPSSTSAEGYTLQISSMPSFIPLWTTPSSSTPNVLLSTLTATGLTGGVTYYFRVGSINWNGVPDFQTYVSTLMPVQLGVMTTSTTIPIAATQAMGATVVISTSVTLTNTGNVSETYSLRATTTTAGSKWSIGASPWQDRYSAWAVVNSTAPGTTDFSASAQLGDAYTSCSPANFTMGNSDGVQVPAGATRLIWVKVAMPLTTSDAALSQQNISVTAQAVKDP